MLQNERYRGVQVWGKYRNTDKGGRTRQRARQDERRWVAVDVPDLRIVDDDLWELAQSRRGAAPQRGPRAYPVSQSLLSGIGSCALCSGPIVISGSTKRSRTYGCGYYRERGASVCDNGALESIAAVDAAFVSAVEAAVLTPEFRRYVVDRAAAKIAARRSEAPTDAVRLERELARVKAETANLIRALESAGDSPAIIGRLKERERESSDLSRALTSARARSGAVSIDRHHIDRIIREKVDAFGQTLSSDVVRARAALAKLLIGRVLFLPTQQEVGGKLRRTYQLEATLAIGRLLVSTDGQGVQGVHVPDGTWTELLEPVRVVVPAVKAA